MEVWLVTGIGCELPVSNDDQPAFLNVGFWWPVILLDEVGACADGGCRPIAEFEEEEGPTVAQPDFLKPPWECTDP